MTQQKWKILVINLAHSTARWESVQRRLNALGLPYQRIEGVAGNKLSKQELEGVFDAEKAKKKYHYQLTRGEIGCYLSHISAWQTIIDEELEFAIILEDDVVFADLFSAVPKAVQDVSQEWDLIKLAAPFKQQKFYPQERINEFEWGRFKKPPMGACGYVLSRQGAQKLLAQRPPIFRPVDVDFQWQSELNLIVRGLLPYTVDNSHEYESDIKAVADRQESKRNLWRRIQHQVALYFDNLRANRR